MKAPVVRPGVSVPESKYFSRESLFQINLGGGQLQDKQFDFELIMCSFFIALCRYLEEMSIMLLTKFI